MAAEAGLSYRWPQPARFPLTNVETFGSGCAFVDADLDGWLDVLLVGSPTCGLYLNRQDGTFADATASSGLAEVKGPWSGCAVGDYDGDGTSDLLLTGLNVIRLLRGVPGARFLDVTAAAGLRPTGWASSAGFMDLDGDGDQDLLIGNYLELDALAPRYCEIVPGVLSSCTPDRFAPQFPRLFRNEGKGAFRDVTTESGLHQSGGKNLALGFTDFDRDGRVDVYFANDGVVADLFHNRGKLQFDNVAVAQGVALGMMGTPQAGMGVDWGDYDRDGRLDLAVTAFSEEPYSIYHHGEGVFEAVSGRVGISEPTRLPLGFGVKWLDFDNDGWLDIAFANGHIHDNVDRIDPRLTFRQSTQLFRSRKGKLFEEVTRQAGGQFSRPIVGRGLATGDYDRDGKVDLLVVDALDRPLLLRNEHAKGNWLEVQLVGKAPNSLAYGARVTLSSPAGPLVREVSPASSYLSSSSPWLHFGLGELAKVEKLVVTWPGGQQETVRCGAINTRVRVLRGSGRAEPQLITPRTGSTAAPARP